MERAFETYHPAVNFIFFCGVILSGVFIMHPLYLGVALAGSFTYAVMLEGKKAVKFTVLFLLPVILVTALINCIANPRGSTVFLHIDHWQFTLEAAVYGLLAGTIISLILLWFLCYNSIVTTDKFTYLFGRIMPELSLVISMVMRFIPNFKMQIGKISDAQKCIGIDVSHGRIREKIRYGVKIISVMFTWALENSIDTADSMKSRGHGMKKRTTFSIYRFDRRDALTVITFAILIIVFVLGVLEGVCKAEFYPYMEFSPISGGNVIFLAAYFLLCFFPVIIEIKEIALWKNYKLKI